MTNLRFFKLLFASIVISLILSEGIIYLLDDSSIRFFGLLSIAFFAIFCQVFFVFAKNAQQAKNPNSFIRLSIINIMVKIVLVFILVGVYYKLAQPTPQRYFLLPFLSSYLVFLCFETYFMFELSKENRLNK